MSRAPWTPSETALRRHPQLAMLAVLENQLHLVVAALAAAHRGQAERRPELNKARRIAQAARALQAQVEDYRGFVLLTAEPSLVRSTARAAHPRRR